MMEVKQNGNDEELRIESDDDDDAGGCKSGNDDIMDLEDMGDYIETSHPTKVRYGWGKDFLGSKWDLGVERSTERDGHSIDS